MSGEDVDRAVRRVGARRPDLTMAAQAVAGGLTAGEGIAMIHQAALQQYLWWYMPRDYLDDEWQGLVEAAAALLDEIGLPHLADVARSAATRTVLAAWAHGRKEGAAAFRSAHAKSGVEPPNTALLAWGSVMGVDEVRALDAVERALDDAVAAGTLVPGARCSTLASQGLRDHRRGAQPAARPAAWADPRRPGHHRAHRDLDRRRSPPRAPGAAIGGGERSAASGRTAVPLAPAYRFRVESLRELIELIDRQVAACEEQAAPWLAGDLGYHAVQAIPGIGPVLAAVFVAEIGDVQRFPSARHLCSWAGLTPTHHESDQKVRRGHITKQGSRLVRWAAVEGVVRQRGATAIAAHHHRVGERRGTNVGRVAAARKLLTLVYYGLRDGEIRCLAKAG